MNNKRKLRGDIPMPDEARIAQVISDGQKYMDNHIPVRTPPFLLFREQTKYVSPFLWATQILVLLITIIVAQIVDPSPSAAGEVLFRLAPLTAFLAVPELFKDIQFDMSELEGVCKHNSGTIMLFRLAAIGLLNLFVLGASVTLLSISWELNFLTLVLYALVPFNFLNVINIFLLRQFKIKSRIGAIGFSLVAAVVLSYLPRNIVIFNLLNNITMLILFVATSIILTCQLVATYREMQHFEEVVAWSL